MKVHYLNKKDTEHYRAGKELHIVYHDRGWVEYLLEHVDLYWIPGMSRAMADHLKFACLEHIQTQWRQQDENALGLIQNLIFLRDQQSFDLPLFVWQGPDETLTTCGKTRLFAEFFCRNDFSQMGFFLQTKKNFFPDFADNAVRINSTSQAESLAKIGHLDHRIAIEYQNQIPVVVSTVLRNSQYDNATDGQGFRKIGSEIIKFWKRFTQDQKINITIHCSIGQQQLVNYNQNIWNISWIENNIPVYQFSEVMSHFYQPSDNQLHLILNPTDQCLMLDWLLFVVDLDHVWYYTKNKRLHLYETSQGPQSARWPIVAIPNLVQ